MFDKTDILDMLKNGATVDEVASKMAEALNAANDEYTAFQEAEAKKLEEEKAAKAEAKRVYEAKREAVCMMLDGLVDFLIAAGEDELVQEVHNVEIADVVSMVDSSLETVRTLLKLREIEFDSGWNKFFGSFFS